MNTNRRVRPTAGVVIQRLVAKSAVAEAACGIAKSLKTDSGAETKVLQADGPGCKTVKRLITHTGVGAGDGVALKSQPPHSHIWADIQPLDVFQGAASGVVQERVRTNGCIAGGGVAVERKGTYRRIVFAGGIIDQRRCSVRRVALAGSV